MKHKLFLVALAAALTLTGCAASSQKSAQTAAATAAKTAAKLTPEQAHARMQSGDPVVVVDVRTKAEYDAGHIPGAILIPNEEIGTERPALLPDLNAEILVYCRSGHRSGLASQKLVDMGYTNINDFGGIISWTYETVVEASK